MRRLKINTCCMSILFSFDLFRLSIQIMWRYPEGLNLCRVLWKERVRACKCPTMKDNTLLGIVTWSVLRYIKIKSTSEFLVFAVVVAMPFVVAEAPLHPWEKKDVKLPVDLGFLRQMLFLLVFETGFQPGRFWIPGGGLGYQDRSLWPRRSEVGPFPRQKVCLNR